MNRVSLCADSPGLSPEARQEKGLQLVCFSEVDLLALHPGVRGELRTRSRGLVVLISLLRALQPDWHPFTGVYLYCGPGPSSPRAQQEILAAPASQRAAVLERALPPKDYFISNPAMKAAQLSIEFQLHGPWTAFLSPHHGLIQAWECARNDLLDQVVPAALVAGLFALDEPSELSHHTGRADRLVEAVWAQYSLRAEELLRPEGASGPYGPLTGVLGRG